MDLPDVNRCSWAGTDPLYVAYHDREWGVPVLDDHKLFEFLVLEGAQAGLSWLTILRKRENFRRAFEGFDYRRLADHGPEWIEELLRDPGIIRNRLKVESVVNNARAFLAVQEEYGSFAEFSWRYVGGKPKKNAWKTLAEIPATSREADLMSRDMKKLGFKFVGPTIIYAHMQAVGMVNDHLVDCFRYDQV
ncbi:MAG: DNA-3-methyladenine glycosylase I [Pseudomonadota bacterium]